MFFCTFLHEQIFEDKNVFRINLYKALNRHFLNEQIVGFRIHTKVYKGTEMAKSDIKAT